MAPPASSSKADAVCGCTPAVANTPRNDSAISSERRLDWGSMPTQTTAPTPAERAASTTRPGDRKSTRLNSSHPSISYAVFCLKKKKKKTITELGVKEKKITSQ